MLQTFYFYLIYFTDTKIKPKGLKKEKLQDHANRYKY